MWTDSLCFGLWDTVLESELASVHWTQSNIRYGHSITADVVASVFVGCWTLEPREGTLGRELTFR